MGIIRYSDESFFGIVWENFTSVKHVAKCLDISSSDPSAELVELGKSESIGVVDDHGVCVEKVYSVFYDGRGEEDIVFSFFKIHDSVF